jgi:hypothetical protein
MDTVYMVNVDRWPGSSPADVAELKSIAASMVIDQG